MVMRSLSRSLQLFSRNSACKFATAKGKSEAKGGGKLGGAAAGKSGKRKGAEGDGGQKAVAEHLQNFILLAEQAKKIKPTLTPEEQEEHNRIGKEYQRQSMKRTNRLNKDLATKIWLQQEAMRALPENLRKAAEIVDDSPPPRDRPFPTWFTPPIKGFDPRVYEQKAGDDEVMEETTAAPATQT